MDPSSVLKAPSPVNAILRTFFAVVELGQNVVISDSAGLLQRLNSKSTLDCALRDFELADFLGFNSLPRWSVKSSSRSIDDSSSVSFAEDIEVHAVAVLPLLSDELDDWPRRRHSEDSIC